jgi:hypothetical protein
MVEETLTRRDGQLERLAARSRSSGSAATPRGRTARTSDITGDTYAVIGFVTSARPSA